MTPERAKQLDAATFARQHNEAVEYQSVSPRVAAERAWLAAGLPTSAIGFARAKSAIQRDLKKWGKKRPRSFAAMHDLCDANEYLVIAMGYTGFHDPRIDAIDVCDDAHASFANVISAQLDAWLTRGK